MSHTVLKSFALLQNCPKYSASETKYDNSGRDDRVREKEKERERELKQQNTQ